MFASVYFDCDSTLSRIEAIDELAHGCSEDVRARILALTADAMDGRRPLDEVYARRLDLVRPNREALDAVGRAYVEAVVPGAREVVEALRALGKEVGIVSGGLEPPVRHLAADLGIPSANVHAVAVELDGDGRYVGFDTSSPLARAGGKIEVLARIEDDARPICFVGDGITDLETADVVEAFVGFGGVARRDAVVAGSETFLDGPDLRALLDVVLTPEERAKAPT